MHAKFYPFNMCKKHQNELEVSWGFIDKSSIYLAFDLSKGMHMGENYTVYLSVLGTIPTGMLVIRDQSSVSHNSY